MNATPIPKESSAEAPDFALADVNGDKVRLSQFRGSFAVLAFLRGFM